MCEQVKNDFQDVILNDWRCNRHLIKDFDWKGCLFLLGLYDKLLILDKSVNRKFTMMLGLLMLHTWSKSGCSVELIVDWATGSTYLLEVDWAIWFTCPRASISCLYCTSIRQSDFGWQDLSACLMLLAETEPLAGSLNQHCKLSSVTRECAKIWSQVRSLKATPATPYSHRSSY